MKTNVSYLNPSLTKWKFSPTISKWLYKNRQPNYQFICKFYFCHHLQRHHLSIDSHYQRLGRGPDGDISDGDIKISWWYGFKTVITKSNGDILFLNITKISPSMTDPMINSNHHLRKRYHQVRYHHLISPCSLLPHMSQQLKHKYTTAFHTFGQLSSVVDFGPLCD